jgi:hypothetical protein
MPTMKQLAATFGPGAVITAGPSLTPANQTTPPPASEANPCKRAYLTAFAEPYTQGAHEVATTQNGSLKEEWNLWQFPSTTLAATTMTDVANVGRSCGLSDGLGVEDFHLSADFAAGFETIDPAPKGSTATVKVVWIFIRSKSTVAVAVVNTEDSTTLAKLVGVEIGTLS